jgi:hypothetical protein
VNRFSFLVSTRSYIIRKYYVQSCLVLFGTLSLSSCGLFNFDEAFKDTCNQGMNMTNPRVVGGFDAASLSPTLVITWDTGTGRGAELPDRYFAEVTGYSIEEFTATFNSSPKNITLTFGSLSNFLAKKDRLEVTLNFPDRRGYIDCRHPASPDRYYLNILLKFSGEEFLSAEFMQGVSLGAF